MERQVIYLTNPTARRNVAHLAATAPDGYRVEIKAKTRTLAQNDILWSILTDISRQVDFVVNGALVKVSPEEVKDILTASLRRETRMAMGIDGGMVLLGQRTSKMTVRQLSDLIELAHAFGADKGVRWSPTSIGRAA
ncbi:recombination protein NinB [Castellaniella denitrificans]|uniref:Recombination protein NinB n=1 Tax=Castellaniella denitrificans TaxID=56119 RepID=A0ABT4M6X2_9BURK|nr:recombination protein NinB [Castellaniella denitrificans]MCZ4331077.1 recombination protein NinB [Castellaniella denitrificans]